MPIDYKSRLDVESRLDKVQTRRLLSEFFKRENRVSFSKHAKKEMSDDNLYATDIINVLHKGNIHSDPEFKNGSWRYRVETNKVMIVIAFRNPDFISVVTVWRKK